MEFLKTLPPNLINFLLVTVFSLLIGLSQRRIHSMTQEGSHTFGTDRTFTFIGILGFVLFLFDWQHASLFIGGGLILGIIFSISYYFHIKEFKDYGATTILIALITYCIGPLVMTQPRWMVLLIVVTVLVLTELKDTFGSLSQKFDRYEFLTLGKFLIIAGVILPIVPDTPFVPDLSLTPYKIWLAIVVISTISYLSYLLKKFVFKKASIILSGILGGLYSSTATTIILAKKSKKEPHNVNQYVAGILYATSMMYLRILILIFIFTQTLFFRVWPYFIALFILSAVVGTIILFFRNKTTGDFDEDLSEDKNPLEFKMALIFTALYVAFTIITYLVITKYGALGLNVLSYIVGLTDIDPFLINLFQGKYAVPVDVVAMATLQAIISNNFLKMCYGCFFGSKTAWKFLISGFLIIIAVNLVFVFIV
ncbi:MAG: DUF4010 domain-containing protein [bacterium]